MTDGLKSPHTRAQPGNASVCAADKMADWHTDVSNFPQAPDVETPVQAGPGPHSDQCPAYQGLSAAHLRSTKDTVSTDVHVRDMS